MCVCVLFFFSPCLLSHVRLPSFILFDDGFAYSSNPLLAFILRFVCILFVSGSFFFSQLSSFVLGFVCSSAVKSILWQCTTSAFEAIKEKHQYFRVVCVCVCTAHLSEADVFSLLFIVEPFEVDK